MEPITAGLVLQLTTGLLGNLFSTPAVGPAGPTTAQIAAMLARQKSEADANRNAWMLGLGLVAVGAVGMVWVFSRK